ncbi:MAG: prepilin-type N-terminal cleavage/methylation domain-containing protein [bacterium]|nr:prepilin-type N-terminal cleavage/methylation domain-containing protein [bacterium]
MNQSGFTLVEILVVISIMAVIAILAIPPFTNLNKEQSVIQSINKIRSDLQLAMNNSSSGKNGHWYGLTFLTRDNRYSNYNNTYRTFEMLNTTSCPITILSINSPPCSMVSNKKFIAKQYQSGVYLDQIKLYDNNGTHIDTVDSIDIRFNQSPNANQIVISSGNTETILQSTIARAELVYKFNDKNNNHEKALVIDGGNICDKGIVPEPTKCGGDITGGPKAGRYFVVSIQ